jgi:hypothetical protein
VLAACQLIYRREKKIAALAIVGSLMVTACSLFGPAEKARDEPGRTVYRAAEENPLDVLPDVTPSREKVPGETR